MAQTVRRGGRRHEKELVVQPGYPRKTSRRQRALVCRFFSAMIERVRANHKAGPESTVERCSPCVYDHHITAVLLRTAARLRQGGSRADDSSPVVFPRLIRRFQTSKVACSDCVSERTKRTIGNELPAPTGHPRIVKTVIFPSTQVQLQATRSSSQR
jgi:hypothetical protein